MKTLLMLSVFAAVIASINIAKAEDYCDQVKEGVWVCPIPQKPVQPTCHVFGSDLFCNTQIDEKKKPSNCGWNKVGKYVCW